MVEVTFDWKETDEAIKFLVKASQKRSVVYQVDMKDDSFHFVISPEPVPTVAIAIFLVESYRGMGIRLSPKDIGKII